jgi:hypothetical protein
VKQPGLLTSVQTLRAAYPQVHAWHHPCHRQQAIEERPEQGGAPAFSRPVRFRLPSGSRKRSERSGRDFLPAGHFFVLGQKGEGGEERNQARIRFGHPMASFSGFDMPFWAEERRPAGVLPEGWLIRLC